MGFSIFLQSNVTIKILVFKLKLKDRKTENYKTASGHHKVEYNASQEEKTKIAKASHKTASGHHKVEGVKERVFSKELERQSQNRKRSSQGRVKKAMILT